MGKGWEIAEAPKLGPEVYTHIQKIEDEMDYLVAMRDMTNLAKANQIPSGESIDKLVELAGPIVTDISRSMERSLRDTGEMVKSLFYQFYDAPRKVQVLGRAGITEEDFLFEPASLIPVNMRLSIYMGEVIPQNLVRAKRAMNGCIFHITPNSLHQQQQMTRKLLYFQLWRDGRFPIDPETVGEAMDIPDFGSLDSIAGELGIDTSKRKTQGVLGRFFLWQEIQLAIQMKMQAVIAQQQLAMGLQAQAAGVSAMADQAMEAGGVKPNGQSREGRPPSGQRPPHLERKEMGRSTISES
jgi:hypothetical protein